MKRSFGVQVMKLLSIQKYKEEIQIMKEMLP